MADDSLKDYTLSMLMGGFLMFCLLAFAISFMYSNNPTGLDDGTGEIFSDTYDDYSGELQEVTEEANAILNITANTNPEVSDLGSRDSVAASFDAKRSSSSYFTQGRTLIVWVFSGVVGQILIGVIGGFFSLLAGFAIWRSVRTGT